MFVDDAVAFRVMSGDVEFVSWNFDGALVTHFANMVIIDDLMFDSATRKSVFVVSNSLVAVGKVPLRRDEAATGPIAPTIMRMAETRKYGSILDDSCSRRCAVVRLSDMTNIVTCIVPNWDWDWD